MFNAKGKPSMNVFSSLHKRNALLLLICMFLWLIPAAAPAQSEENNQGPPPIPIAPPLVREGAFAIRLGEALALGTSKDEVEAENKLSEIGILPKNGWMADYPVTPDVIGELYEAIGLAADSKKLSLSREVALQKLNDAIAEVNLPVAPASIEKQIEAVPSGYDNFPNPSIVDNYYGTEGPPIFTYYTPPPSYNYLYDWVPYPFWWKNVWFPGYFILRDFHRTILVNRSVGFVSNHFRDRGNNRFYRIDPVERFRGRYVNGSGVSHAGSFVSPGLTRGGSTIYSGHNAPAISGGRAGYPHSPGSGATANSQNHYAAPITPLPRNPGMVSPPPSGARTFTPASSGLTSRPSWGGGGTSAHSNHGGGSFSSPSSGGGSFSPSSHGGGMSSRSSFGGGVSSGRGGHRR